MNGLTLPRLGMGTAGIGNLYAPVSDELARATVEAAWAADIRYFDTAPHYGFGLAERRLGKALEALDGQSQAIVSTKVGRLLEPTANHKRERHGFVDADPFDPVFDYGRDAILRSHAESLRRLRRDRVDILLAHDLGEMTHGAESERHMHAFLDGGYRAMRDLKESGAVGAIGVGVNEVEVCLFLLERVELDVVLLAGRYTLLDRRAGEELLPLCLERGVGVIVGGPYNSGILARPVARQRDPRYDYGAPPAGIVARASAMEQVCAKHGVELGAAALQFPLRHRAVDSVIPGLVGEAQVREAVERMSVDIPEAVWPELAALGAGGRASAAAEASEVKPKLILLDDNDDVLVCIAPIMAGDRLSIDGAVLRAAEDIGIGHKVARRAIWPGAKIRKYGLPIGSATTTIAAGEWVHAHNMRSDYIPSHNRETVAQGQSQ